MNVKKKGSCSESFWTVGACELSNQQRAPWHPQYSFQMRKLELTFKDYTLVAWGLILSSNVCSSAQMMMEYWLRSAWMLSEAWLQNTGHFTWMCISFILCKPWYQSSPTLILQCFCSSSNYIFTHIQILLGARLPCSFVFCVCECQSGDHVWPLSALICVCFAQGPRAELGEPWFYVRFGK